MALLPLFVCMSKVKIEYIDSSNLSDKEIVSQMRHIFGDSVNISTAPNNNTPRACIKYALQKLVTEDQATFFFDDPARVYTLKMDKKRKEMMNFFNILLEEVIDDNETKWK